jgi:hypothetical protein
MTEDPSHARPDPGDEDGDADLDRALAELTAGHEQAEPVDRPPDGPPVIDYEVPYVRQLSQSQCWYAALQMIVTFRRGRDAQVIGHPKVMREGKARDDERAAVRELEAAGKIGQADARDRLKKLPPRGLEDAEAAELADFNGLSAVTVPGKGWTSDLLVEELRNHGPLWCAIYLDGAATKHVVVVKGVRADRKLLVHDPQNGPNLPWSVTDFDKRLLRIPSGMLYLPAT